MRYAGSMPRGPSSNLHSAFVALTMLAPVADLHASFPGPAYRCQEVEQPDSRSNESADASITVEIVCERQGERKARQDAANRDTEHYDLVDRSVFWLVGKTRYSTRDDLLIALGDLSKERPGAELKMVAGPQIRWQDIIFLFEKLAVVNYTTMRLPGEWKVHPYAMGLEPRPPTDGKAIIGPVTTTPWLAPSERKHVTELRMDQEGRITMDGTMLLDPTEDSDRQRLRTAIAQLGLKARKHGKVEEVEIDTNTITVATSRVLVCADRWAEWQNVYLLMKDLTEADPSFASFDVATLAPPAAAAEDRSDTPDEDTPK